MTTVWFLPVNVMTFSRYERGSGDISGMRRLLEDGVFRNSVCSDQNPCRLNVSAIGTKRECCHAAAMEFKKETDHRLWSGVGVFVRQHGDLIPESASCH